jgi:hypothetical protein
MCDKCVELDERIGRLRTIATQSMDAATIAAANELIKEMEARKTEFHAEQEQ